MRRLFGGRATMEAALSKLVALQISLEGLFLRANTLRTNSS